MPNVAGHADEAENALELVRARWDVDGAFSPQTSLRSVETIIRFTSRARAQGAPRR